MYNSVFLFRFVVLLYIWSKVNFLSSPLKIVRWGPPWTWNNTSSCFLLYVFRSKGYTLILWWFTNVSSGNFSNFNAWGKRNPKNDYLRSCKNKKEHTNRLGICWRLTNLRSSSYFLYRPDAVVQRRKVPCTAQVSQVPPQNKEASPEGSKRILRCVIAKETNGETALLFLSPPMFLISFPQDEQK